MSSRLSFAMALSMVAAILALAFKSDAAFRASFLTFDMGDRLRTYISTFEI